MKRLIKFGSIGLVITGAIATAGQASAQIPPISQYNSTSAAGLTTKSIRIVTTPRVQIPVTVSGQPVTSRLQVRLNNCGQAVINGINAESVSYTRDQLNGFPTGEISVSTLPTTAIPSCDSATGLSSLSNADANTPPAYDVGNGRILINALRPSTNQGRVIDVFVKRTQNRERFVSTNACGIATLNLGDASTVPSFATVSVNGATPVQVSSILNGGTVPIVDCVGSNVVVQSGFPTGTKFKNPDGDVFISSNLPIVATLPSGGNVNRSVTSDRCGGVTLGSAINPQTSSFTLNGVSIDPSSLSTGLRPNCVLGTGGSFSYDVQPTGSVKLSDGRVFVYSTTANPSGFGDRLIYTISTASQSASRTYNRDACGIARIRQTIPAFSEITTDSDGTITVADLATRNYRCRNIPNVGTVGYATP